VEAGFPEINMGYGSGAFVALAFLVAPATVCAEDTDARVRYSAAEYLKNFALSVCISDGYKSDEVVKDSLAAAGGYVELGGFPIEAYEEAAALGKKFLAKEYVSMHGGRLTLMKCIDLFHSNELEQIVKKYNKK
jgi:Type VI secretion system (T6SS), amidase immunity protein